MAACQRRGLGASWAPLRCHITHGPFLCPEAGFTVRMPDGGPAPHQQPPEESHRGRHAVDVMQSREGPCDQVCEKSREPDCMWTEGPAAPHHLLWPLPCIPDPSRNRILGAVYNSIKLSVLSSRMVQGGGPGARGGCVCLQSSLAHMTVNIL